MTMVKTESLSSEEGLLPLLTETAQKTTPWTTFCRSPVLLNTYID